MQLSVFLASIAFVSGVVLLLHLPWLPPDFLFVILFAGASAALWFRFLRVPAMLILGSCYAVADVRFGQQVDLADESFGRELILVGDVVDMPHVDIRRTRLLLQIVSLRSEGDAARSQIVQPGGRVRLNWYGQPAFELLPGQRIEVLVKLRRPRGFINPGAFDYEKWLFRQRIVATGYVRDKDFKPRLIAAESGLSGSRLGRARLQIRQTLQPALEGLASGGQLLALAIGDRSSVSAAARDQYFATGTSHLLAISGLHIGIVAGFFGFLGAALWHAGKAFLPASRAGFSVIAGAMAAIVYAALAGFALPTQRALLMLLALALVHLLARHRRRLDGLSLALLVVCLWDPRVVLGAGFWLSFLAVAVLYLIFSRVEKNGGWHQLWRILRAQWLINIGLAPVTLALFNQVSLVAPVANLIAVPLVGMLVTPIVFIATLLASVNLAVARWLFVIADGLLHWLHVFLQALLRTPFATWQPAWSGTASLLFFAAAVALLLIPFASRMRWLCLPLLLPLFASDGQQVDAGQFDIAFLDVGQGTAIVVLTANHTIVYDSGPMYSSSFDGATAGVLPYLRYRGRHTVDTLIVSHADLDHAGGVRNLIREIPVKQVISSDPLLQFKLAVDPCIAGQRWKEDGVIFEFLHPQSEFRGSENDRSCVLLISSAMGQRVLLAGDIELAGERDLLSHNPAPVDVLLAPHHGSATSSSQALLDALRPTSVIYTTGFENRYGFPAPIVAERYRRMGTSQFDTGRDGALLFRIRRHGIEQTAWRQQRRALWRQ